MSGYGSGDRPIPAGGFVLSAHSGSRPQKADQLEKLRPGDHLSVLDAHGDCLGGYVPTQVLVVLPRGLTLRIDGEDTARSTNQLVLYRVGRGDGHTGTNQYGVEVAVRSGRADSVRDGVGNMAIPGDGFVLSAHDDGRNAAAEALRTLRAGDAVKLLLDRGGRQWDLTATLAERRKVYPVGARCSALYLAVRAGARSSDSTLLGDWVVHYTDGANQRIPIRYAREVLAPSADSLPTHTDDPVWLIDEPSLRCLVREWNNPRPKEPIRELSFEPAVALLDTGATIVAVTAAE